MEEVKVEFKAGKLQLRDRMMQPDTRRGLIRVRRGHDGLMHFQWLERLRVPPGVPPRTSLIDDLIIFPQETKFKKLQQAADRRIYMLQFEQGDRKLFFWMQEQEASNDEEIAKSVNCALNGEEEQMGVSETVPTATEPQEPQVEENTDMSGSAVPMETIATEAQDATTPETPAPNVNQAQLAAALFAAAQSVHKKGPSLAEVLKPDTIIPLLQNPEIQQRLVEYLPEGHQNEEAILELASSPQFQQQLFTFSEALQSGQLNMSAFGLPDSSTSLADFLQSIQNMINEEHGDEESKQDGGSQNQNKEK